MKILPEVKVQFHGGFQLIEWGTLHLQIETYLSLGEKGTNQQCRLYFGWNRVVLVHLAESGCSVLTYLFRKRWDLQTSSSCGGELWWQQWLRGELWWQQWLRSRLDILTQEVGSWSCLLLLFDSKLLTFLYLCIDLLTFFGLLKKIIIGKKCECR